MPLRVEVKISGGEKLKAALMGATGGEYLNAFARNYQQQYTRRVVPELASKTPKRSGDLARSYRTRPTPQGFALTANRYAPFVRFRNPRRVGARNVPGLARRIHGPESSDIGRRAAALANREITR